MNGQQLNSTQLNNPTWMDGWVDDQQPGSTAQPEERGQ
jgi:hypothetical protein